jgi:hypothetical protein
LTNNEPAEDVVHLNFVKRGLSKAIREGVMLSGVDLYLRTDDRRILENVILPYFSRSASYVRILFVGCAWYTRGYRRLFRHADYSTLDYDPSKKRFGSERHVIDSLANIGSHFREDALDLIVCNGVFGWGLDNRSEVDAAFRGCHQCLRRGGQFILGWNDISQHRPFSPYESEGLQLFRTWNFPPLGTSHFVTSTPNRHTFDFFEKVPAQGSSRHRAITTGLDLVT